MRGGKMKEKEVQSAILYLLKIAQEERVPIGKVRLMKLLYLLDVKYCRYYGEIYTGLEWVFYKYGPFTFKIEDLLDKIGVTEEEILLEKGKIFKQLKYEFDMGEENVKPSVKSRGILKNLFKEWGSTDLNQLLDYVYFDTEPMENAGLRRKLDFSKIILYKGKEKIAISPYTKKKLREICHKIKQDLDEIKTPPGTHLIPVQDMEITSIWDREEIAKYEELDEDITAFRDLIREELGTQRAKQVNNGRKVK